ncbi:sensor histidine kinase [Methylobacterium flocculans]|uniref:sensor histidine kinase n=1 Tax=Methylobacterium flocculans TaxID=2984843 RepID=UPI0021F2D5D2|nr:HWE histidine kinase domain-containing protein [Methylobacterium sp. FF17]
MPRSTVSSERALILAPFGRDATIAGALLTEAGLTFAICRDLGDLLAGMVAGAGLVLLTEEAAGIADLGPVNRWIAAQPPWSDLPFILLTTRGGGPERNPKAKHLSETLGNVTFLERPFHPTTLISLVRTALRGRRRQYEARARLVDLHAGEQRLRGALAAEKRSADHQRLLIDELNHRVKNTLATVQSIATQTLRNAATTEDARDALETRLLALSRAHDVLTRENWEGADLSDIIAQAIAPYDPQDGGRFRVGGPDVRLLPRTALALAMALQELATNAVKYGALSSPAGHVEIAWTMGADDPKPRLNLRWSEKGGPTVVMPKRRGFGSRLIERNLARDLDGKVEIAFVPQGVTCTVNAPLR